MSDQSLTPNPPAILATAPEPIMEAAQTMSTAQADPEMNPVPVPEDIAALHDRLYALECKVDGVWGRVKSLFSHLGLHA